MTKHKNVRIDKLSVLYVDYIKMIPFQEMQLCVRTVYLISEKALL